MEFAVWGEALNGGDTAALGFHGGRDAGGDGHAIQEHCACAALAFAARDFRPDEAQPVAENVGKGLVRMDVRAHFGAVDVHGQRLHLTLL